MGVRDRLAAAGELGTFQFVRIDKDLYMLESLRFNLFRCRRRATFAAQMPAALALAVLIAGPVVFSGRLAADEATTAADAAAESRLSSAVAHLASDDLQGRGIGTEGLNLAADYIAEKFSELGLSTDLYDGTPFQTFDMSTGARLGDLNQVTLIGPAGEGADESTTLDLTLGEDFTPLALGGSGKIDLPLVFVGYGITAKDEGYDDYEGLDVDGKAVVILRHEPQQANPHSAFNGTEHSSYAPFVRKVANAYEHGAAAAIFCTDEFEIKKNVERRLRRWDEALEKLEEAADSFREIENPTLQQIQSHEQRIDKLINDVRDEGEKLTSEYDPLLKFSAAGGGEQGRRFPVLQMRRGVIDKMLVPAIGSSLSEIEEAIDQGPVPQSGELQGWRIRGDINVVRDETEVKNVVAVLEGEGPRADETIVIGAHYDHLGSGGGGSLSPGSDEIHNGADDNASGTAALIEVARRLATRTEPLPRRIVFIAFTAEERGLIGSARYVRDPAVPLEQTIAMLNMDMVGRLKDEKLIVHGTGTAAALDQLVDRFNETYGFEITKRPSGFGPSDHSSFYAKKVPVLHFFTGTHRDYHRPSDDFDKVNVPGMRRVAEMVTDIAVALAEADEPPEYLATARQARQLGSGDRPYFGSIPDFSQDQPGYAITGVTKDGPAERGGMRGGDIIVRFGDSKIDGLEDFDSALRKYKAGDKVKVLVKRGEDEVTLEVKLDPPR